LRVNGIPSNFPYHKSQITELVIAFDDTVDFKLPADQLEICFNFIAREVTLVVCTAGRSRSASVCIAYLMKKKGLSFKAAFDKVKKARPLIEPNAGFMI